jgi:hypothetical protein
VPRAGAYRVRVRIEPPTFARIDSGRPRYQTCVQTEFDAGRIGPAPMASRTHLVGAGEPRLPAIAALSG